MDDRALVAVFIRKLREAYTIMEIASLKQPPLNTTLMGCIKGASDYFDGDRSTPMLFGLTGHAFLVNIHKDLHPSSPYVWHKKRFWELLAGIGVDMVAEYALNRDTSESERRLLEDRLKGHLDEGRLCMLNFLEHQLFSGYDERGFALLRPWGGRAPSEVPALSFGTWEECLAKEGWAHFAVLARTSSQKPIEQAARAALAYALELQTDPRPFEVDGYRIGTGAYENWIAGVERGLGASHGHGWNAMVWTECRGKAAEFFGELAELTTGAAAQGCGELQDRYREVAAAISSSAGAELSASEQVRFLKQARDAEQAASASFRTLAAAL